jgi:peptidyl-prolyl cis-trans isomerase C
MLGPALALSLALAAPAPAPRVLAQVDAVEITRADLDERLRVLRASGIQARPSAAVDGLVAEALLAAEARRLGLDRDPAVAADVDRERRRLAADAFLASIVPEPPEAQLRELFHQTADSARLVLVKVPSEAEARAIVERVKAGGDLGEEARKSADTAAAARRGDTGLVSRAALDPALADQVFRAAPGALVGPVQLELGWAVAKVVERQVADDATFPARREAIAVFAREQLRGEARAHVMEQLRKRSGTKLDEPFLREVGQSGPPTEKDLAHVIAVVNGKPVLYRDIAAVERNVGRGHGAAGARISFAWREVDRRLLEDEAIAKGFDRSPSVAAVFPGIERNLLASAAAARIARKPDAGLDDPAVQGALGRLRRAAQVRVDQDAVAAAERETR